MKTALQKSPIPRSHAFVAKRLKAPLFDPNWHFHSEYQLFVVLKGKGTKFIGDNVRRYVEGDITFTGPNLPHLWRSDHEGSSRNDEHGSEGIVVYFHKEFLGETFMMMEEAIKLRSLLNKSLRGLNIYGGTAIKVQKMILRLLQVDGFDRVLELLNILNLLSESSEIELLASPGYVNTQKEGDTERMNKVYTYVMKNYQQKMSISILAELTNMTPTSFSRYFKTHANRTFSEFVSEIRVGHACKLLIDKKMNASQACYQRGFQTLSNFNKQFKTITKRTPVGYKKEYGAL